MGIVLISDCILTDTKTGMLIQLQYQNLNKLANNDENQNWIKEEEKTRNSTKTP